VFRSQIQQLTSLVGRILIATAGVSEELHTAVRRVCERNRMFTQCGHASTIVGLRAFPQTPHMMLMDGDWSGGTELGVLGQLHRELPATRILLVEDAVELGRLARAIQNGVWGVLARERAGRDLQSAMRAVVQGELWLSRRQLSNLLMLKCAEETYVDLSQLTARENAVAREVLSGCSNKEVAQRLDISEHTVAVHLHSIYVKLNLRCRSDLFIHHGTHPMPEKTSCVTHRSRRDAEGI
jgi:DNA-binding NarL/FixJ family response regulator